MPIEVEIDLEWRGKRYREIEAGLQAIGKDLAADFDKVGPIVQKTLKEYMKGVVGSVRQRISSPYPSGTSPAGQFPGSLSKRSGALLASFSDSRIEVKGGKDIAVSYTLSGIASVHERGAVITPKKSKYLTVPLPPALNANGTPKMPNARAWQNTFIIKSKKGNLLIVRRKGAGIEPLYVLKKKVVIPKRLAFEEAFQAGKDFLADKIAQDVIREFFQ